MDNVQNDNLFKAIVCAPISALFVLLAFNSVTNAGIVIFQVLFVILALFFVLSTLAYAAHYTNDVFAEAEDH